ncbi:MAG TPA: transcription termination/antitermination NusG family protein [Bryobacteraceae bacterium]|nr:transcription termination/antitermination NusG family protein [Bryobacteraceae bacterium]
MNVDTIHNDDSLRWFALRVRSRCEKVVANLVRRKGFDEFVPLYRCYHNWSDRRKRLDLPLFPGYVFCRLDPRYRLPVLTIPGALHFAGFGKIPSPLDDAEILAIRRAICSGLATEPWEYLETGQRVKLESGPLAGMEGILVETPNQCRAVVSISLLRRSVAVQIERRWLSPVSMGISNNAAPAKRWAAL